MFIQNESNFCLDDSMHDALSWIHHGNHSRVVLPNVIRRRAKRVIPDDEKDNKYWEKRHRNNVAAKRSRENKRQLEMLVRTKVTNLEVENALLQKEMTLLKNKFGLPLRHCMLTDDEKEKCIRDVTSAQPPVTDIPAVKPTECFEDDVSSTSQSTPFSSNITSANFSSIDDNNRYTLLPHDNPLAAMNCKNYSCYQNDVETASSFNEDSIMRERTQSPRTVEKSFHHGSLVPSVRNEERWLSRNQICHENEAKVTNLDFQQAHIQAQNRLNWHCQDRDIHRIDNYPQKLLKMRNNVLNVRFPSKSFFNSDRKECNSLDDVNSESATDWSCDVDNDVYKSYFNHVQQKQCSSVNQSILTYGFGRSSVLPTSQSPSLMGNKTSQFPNCKNNVFNTCCYNASHLQHKDATHVTTPTLTCCNYVHVHRSKTCYATCIQGQQSNPQRYCDCSVMSLPITESCLPGVLPLSTPCMIFSIAPIGDSSCDNRLLNTTSRIHGSEI